MKIRNDFVTNSSSSSFVIAFKQEGLDQLDEFLKNAPTIFKAMAKVFDGVFLSGTLIKTKEQLDEYIVEYYGYSEQNTIESILEDEYNDYIKALYDKSLKCLNNGYAIIKREIDNSDEFMYDFFSGLDDNENFILIER